MKNKIINSDEVLKNLIKEKAVVERAEEHNYVRYTTIYLTLKMDNKKEDEE